MDDSFLPPDYPAFKYAVLADAHDDWLGVHEVWYSANSRYPAAPLSERLAVAERVVADLLLEDRVRLYRGPITGPSEDGMIGPDATPLLLDWTTWVPDDDSMYWLVAIDASTVGANAFSVRKPDASEPPNRVFGRMKGEIVVHGDFDADNEEIAREFEASIAKPLDP